MEITFYSASSSFPGFHDLGASDLCRLPSLLPEIFPFPTDTLEGLFSDAEVDSSPVESSAAVPGLSAPASAAPAFDHGALLVANRMPTRSRLGKYRVSVRCSSYSTRQPGCSGASASSVPSSSSVVPRSRSPYMLRSRRAASSASALSTAVSDVAAFSFSSSVAESTLLANAAARSSAYRHRKWRRFVLVPPFAAALS